MGDFQFIEVWSRIISNDFAVFSLLVLSLVTVSFVFMEKRRRKISLQLSPESKEIDELYRTGKISEEEAGKLKRNANALPEVKEDYPLPDIHLRLTAALAKVFSLLKIILILSNVFIFYLIWRMPTGEGVVKTLHTSNGCFLAIIYCSIVILSIMQFIASIYLCKGGLLSRKYLNFIWIVDLVILPLVLLKNSFLYFIPAVPLAAYSIWVLYLRKNAGDKIAYDYLGKYKHRTAVITAVMMVSMTCGIVGIFSGKIVLKINHRSNITKSSSSISSLVSNHCYSLDSVAVISMDPSDETAEFCRKLVDAFNKKRPDLNYRLLGYNKSFPEGTIKFDQFVFVTKTRILKPEAPDIPENVRNIIRKDVNKFSGVNLPANCYVNGKSLTFKVSIESRFNLSTHFGSHSYLRLVDFSAYKGWLVVSSSIDGCSKEEAVRKCVDETAKVIVKACKNSNAVTKIRLPDSLALTLKKTEFDKSAVLENSWNIGKFRSAVYDNFSIYLFPLEKNRKQQKAALVKKMSLAGWKYHPYEGRKELLRFTRNDDNSSFPKVVVYLPPDHNPNEIIWGETSTEEFFGHLAYMNKPEQKFTRKDAEILKKYDFPSYLACVSIWKLSKNDRKEIIEYILNNDNIPFNIICNKYRYLKVGEFPELKDRLLKLLAERLKRNVGQPGFAIKMRSFIDCLWLDGDDFSEHPQFKYFKKYYHRLKLKYSIDDCWFGVENIFNGLQLPLVVEICDVGKKHRNFVTIVSKKDGVIEMVTTCKGTGGASSVYNCDTNNKLSTYMQFVNCSKNFCSSSCMGAFWAGESRNRLLQADALCLFYDFGKRKKTLKFTAIYKGK